MTKMILAIDGNVNTGKTTLFYNLKEKYPDYYFSEEYQVVRCDDVLERQLAYLHQDEHRTIATAKNVILDRSVLSLLGYIYWLYKYEKVDIRRSFYSRLLDGVRKKKYNLPNKLVYCYSDSDMIKKCYNSNHQVKGTDSELVSNTYLDSQNEFYEKLCSQLKGSYIMYNYKLANGIVDIHKDDKVIDNQTLLQAIAYALDIHNISYPISINGTTSIGKSTICKFFERQGSIVCDEVRMVNYSQAEQDAIMHQLKYFQASLKRYEGNSNCVIDNGVFETISFTFHLASQREYGLPFIAKYLEKASELVGDMKLGQMFYMYVSDAELKRRKCEDHMKVREHFEENIIFRNSEKQFAQFLSVGLQENFFVIVDASQCPENIYYECRMHRIWK